MQPIGRNLKQVRGCLNADVKAVWCLVQLHATLTPPNVWTLWYRMVGTARCRWRWTSLCILASGTKMMSLQFAVAISHVHCWCSVILANGLITGHGVTGVMQVAVVGHCLLKIGVGESQMQWFRSRITSTSAHHHPLLIGVK